MVSNSTETDIYYAIMGARASGCSLDEFVDAVKREWQNSLTEEADNIARQRAREQREPRW